MLKNFNVATGIFKGFNDHEGIMICGYEWGGKDNETTEIKEYPDNLGVIFSNKAPFYGPEANTWRYDQKIIKWFKLWGHELKTIETSELDNCGEFEKCLLQTNWCNTQAPNMNNINYADKLLAPDQIQNFLIHVNHFRPKLIIFIGSSMIHFLNNRIVLDEFIKIMGPITEELIISTKPFNGKKFKVGFQSFKNCKIVSLPHASSSRGLKDEYIQLFSSEIGTLISEVKEVKKIA